MDCVPAYTAWRMTEDMLAAIGLGAILVALAAAGRYLIVMLLDAAAVDL